MILETANGKALALVALSLFALLKGWVFTFMVALGAALMVWMLFGDN